MSLIELFFIAVGLSMDAFAVAVCAGLTMTKATMRKAVVVGLYFGVFQAVMPLVGYMGATLFAAYIIAYDHWIAFALLCFLGGKMIAGGLRKKRPNEKLADDTEASLKPVKMLPLAVATSIDALAVGVSFAFLNVGIIPAVLLIGATTFLLSIVGVKTGGIFGYRLKSRAEIAGGVILALIGLKILLEHLEVINF